MPYWSQIVSELGDTEAESAPFDDAPDDDIFDDAREALNEIIAERCSLHSDEPAPRGG